MVYQVLGGLLGDEVIDPEEGTRFGINTVSSKKD